MRILFLKPKHIGDSLLLTPIITAVKRKYPRAKIWVLVRRGCEGILHGCPQIDYILTTAEIEKRDRSWRTPINEIGTRALLTLPTFDYVFELGDGNRSRGIAWMCRAKKRFSVRPESPLPRFWLKLFNGISKHDWSLCHRVEKDYHTVAPILKLDGNIPPLVFQKRCAREWDGLAGVDNFALMHVGARQLKKRWPVRCWVEVGRFLLKKFDHLIISCGPALEERRIAKEIQKELGLRAYSTDGSTTWPEMAGLLYRTPIFVTLDSAAMHLAAACQTPTVALFGPSIEEHWHPWQSPHRIVTAREFPLESSENGIALRQQGRKMEQIEPADVIQALEELMAQPACPPILAPA